MQRQRHAVAILKGCCYTLIYNSNSLSFTSRHILVSGVHIFVNALPIFGNADLVIALRQFAPQRVTYQIIDFRLGLLLVRPMIQFGDFRLDSLKQRRCTFLDFLDIRLGQVMLEQQII
jgi:hypothetical protein